MNLITGTILKLRPTLSLRLTGEYCERLLNVLAAHRILFWNPKRTSNGYTVTVYAADLQRIRKIRRPTGVRIHVEKRNGLAFAVRKYRMRFGFLAGAALFVGLLFYLSGGLWIITVSGNRQVQAEQVKAVLSEYGIRPGCRMREVDPQFLKQELPLHLGQISWASLNRQGCVLEVNISESDSTRKSEQPCNIIAACDGTITDISVTSGELCVKTGQTVLCGQVLISGIHAQNGFNEWGTAQGEIHAKVPGEFSENLPIEHSEKVPDGKIRSHTVLEFFSLRIPLYLGEIQGEYDRQAQRNTMRILGGELPISMDTFRYFHYTVNSRTLDEETALEFLRDRWQDSCRGRGETSPEILKETLQKAGDHYAYSVQYEAIRQIGIPASLPSIAP